MKKKALNISIIILGFASVLTVKAQCTSSRYECGKVYRSDYGGKPFMPGCETLEVIIHNKTNYTFVVDNDYLPSPDVRGESNFNRLDPPSDETDNNGIQSYYVKGTLVNNDPNHSDDVDTSVRYLAQINNKNTGAYFILNLKKKSCNVTTATYRKDDRNCYDSCRHCSDHCYWDCREAYCDVSCASDKNSPDAVCAHDYKYFHSYNCHYASQDQQSSLSEGSYVSTSSGLYTLGARLDSTHYGYAQDPTVLYTTYSNFRCDKYSICGDPGGDDPEKAGCITGTKDHNTTSRLEFYIYPSPIETLTVTFPDSAETPMGKIIRDVVLKNLNPAYIEKLGLYYSFAPVKVSGSSISFSTLCNSSNCPR